MSLAKGSEPLMTLSRGSDPQGESCQSSESCKVSYSWDEKKPDKYVEEKKDSQNGIYFVRHGESRFNAGFGDEYDCGLTETGIKQASNLFGDVNLVIVSPLKRARQTLQKSTIVFKHLLVSSLCRERRNVSNCDYLEGETKVMETDEQFGQRVLEFRQLLHLLTPFYPRILVVSHGIFIMATTGRTTPIGNCEFFQWIV